MPRRFVVRVAASNCQVLTGPVTGVTFQGRILTAVIERLYDLIDDEQDVQAPHAPAPQGRATVADLRIIR